MPQLIKGSQIVDDDWQVMPKPESAPEAAEVPAGKVIVPVTVWQAARARLLERDAPLGVWLDSDEAPELIVDDLARFAVIAINFPAFSDGRGYSYARKLREGYGYRGELRAIGDVLRDQLFYLKRCGFDAFAVRSDRDIHDALAGLSDFTYTYQGAADDPVPLFRRR